jgi:hypothetical protein
MPKRVDYRAFTNYIKPLSLAFVPSPIFSLLGYVMSKRRVVAGGYAESSDGFEDEPVSAPEPPVKKAKPEPFAPPRSSCSSTRGSMSLGPASVSSRRPTPLLEPTSRSQSANPPTLRNTPELNDSQALREEVCEYNCRHVMYFNFNLTSGPAPDSEPGGTAADSSNDDPVIKRQTPVLKNVSGE